MAFNWCRKLRQTRVALLGLTNRGKHAQLSVGSRELTLTRAALVGVNVGEHMRLLAASTNGSKMKHAGLFLNV